jgi:hypothetical protein
MKASYVVDGGTNLQAETFSDRSELLLLDHGQLRQHSVMLHQLFPRFGVRKAGEKGYLD